VLEVSTAVEAAVSTASGPGNFTDDTEAHPAIKPRIQRHSILNISVSWI
jgi:hypothetical protein